MVILYLNNHSCVSLKYKVKVQGVLHITFSIPYHPVVTFSLYQAVEILPPSIVRSYLILLSIATNSSFVSKILRVISSTGGAGLTVILT
jgi:hypothetical protein